MPKKTTPDNSLADIHPDIAKEWHPTKNGALTFRDFGPKSGKKIWWICKSDHEWVAKIDHRTSGNGCPFCSGLVPS